MTRTLLPPAAIFAVLLLLGLSLAYFSHKPHASGQAIAYADPASCLQCHADAAAGYASTGMAHSFSKPHPGDLPADNNFYHAASDTFYSMIQRDGRYLQRRWQKGFNGALDNVEELQVDYVMGSGNHVKTYLHREPDGSLIELPVAWYAEAGGHLAMNPGFDNPDPATHQVIAYECMFCHNGYPRIAPLGHRDPAQAQFLGDLPEGIDCQRCHGPGQQHVDAAHATGTALERIRASILNPIRLSPERQMEVCEQCHLETTSRRLPDRIRHFDREPFDYIAGQPLEAFNAYFERSSGNTGNFEIVSAPYRLRQSRCFLESQGALTCERCHDPHDLHKGPTAAPYYAGICMKCHAPGLPAQIAVKAHPTSNDCVSCHMPRRRTEDVVHVAMTDHLIQRRPPPAQLLLAARREIEPTDHAYRGEVARYHVSSSPPQPQDALYDATAQVRNDSNLEAGVPQLSHLLDTQHPRNPEFAIALGDALRTLGRPTDAIAAYRQALAVDPLSSRGQRSLAVMLAESGQRDAALSVLNHALQLEPGNSTLWYEQALIEAQQGQTPQAVADMRKALALKPDSPDAQNTLGVALLQSGDTAAAEAAFRAALVINPYRADTRANLARLLASRGDWQQAAFQLKKSTELDLTVANTHADYASVLAQLQRLPEAQLQAEAALKLEPSSPQAHLLLGELQAQRGQMAQAGTQFEAALTLNPNLAAAEVDLGLVLLQRGDRTAAISHLQHAAQSPDRDTAQRARELLEHSRVH